MAGKSNRTHKNSTKAGINFPVARFHRKFKEGRYSDKTSLSAAIFAAATMEYLTMEIMDIAGEAAKEANRKVITPRHIQIAFRNDDELNKCLLNTTIFQGGVVADEGVFEKLFKNTKSKAGKK